MPAIYRQTLRDMMADNADRYADSPALVCDGVTLTFAQYATQSRRLASALHRAGIRPQDRVGMLGMNSINYCVIYGACALYGFIASTVNFRLAAPEIQYVVNDAAQRILIFEEGYVDAIDRIRAQLKTVEKYVVIGRAPDWAISWDDFVAGGDDAGPDLPPPSADDIAFLMYTSGTTGRPKGVMLEQGGQIENGKLIAQALQTGVQERMLLMMPFFHIGAKAVEVAQHWQAGVVHIHRMFDPEAIFRTIQDERITITHMAPTMIQMLLDHPARENYDLSSLKALLYSAAAMPTPVLRRALKAFGPIFVQMYGQTEGSGTMLPISAHKPDGNERDVKRLGSIGYPIPGVRFKIVDEEDRELPVGEPGEMCFQGPAMMRGYWNNSPSTIEALRGGWVHTGDIAKFDDDGYLYLVDRKKDMIVSGGENIYSREVEEALLQHPEISEAAVIGMPHDKWGEAVCAVIVLVPGSTLTEEDIVKHSRKMIAGYKRPQTIHLVSELPKLVSGKISKVELRARYAAAAS